MRHKLRELALGLAWIAKDHGPRYNPRAPTHTQHVPRPMSKERREPPDLVLFAFPVSPTSGYWPTTNKTPSPAYAREGAESPERWQGTASQGRGQSLPLAASLRGYPPARVRLGARSLAIFPLAS